jgi:hypothetical protein
MGIRKLLSSAADGRRGCACWCLALAVLAGARCGQADCSPGLRRHQLHHPRHGRRHALLDEATHPPLDVRINGVLRVRLLNVDTPRRRSAMHGTRHPTPTLGEELAPISSTLWNSADVDRLDRYGELSRPGQTAAEAGADTSETLTPGSWIVARAHRAERRSTIRPCSHWRSGQKPRLGLCGACEGTRLARAT